MGRERRWVAPQISRFYGSLSCFAFPWLLPTQLRNLTGVVRVRFLLGEQGRIGYVAVAKGYGFDEETVRLVRLKP